jgi:hypothetical protein
LLLDMLAKLKKEDDKIVGIGAPMQSSTLLNYCKIDGSVLDYLAEVNKLKIGTYSPGMHIPVVPESNMLEDQPDVALILSWNLADTIIKNLRNGGYKGRFIVPLPYPKMIR